MPHPKFHIGIENLTALVRQIGRNARRASDWATEIRPLAKCMESELCTLMRRAKIGYCRPSAKYSRTPHWYFRTFPTKSVRDEKDD